VRELREGLWHWQSPHPAWTADEPWPQEVSSYAIDDGTRLLLFDPLAVPAELRARATDREPVIVLTAPWHERDTQALVGELGARILTPPADTAQDLIDKYGITAEQAGDGSPDLAWLRAADGVDVRWYTADDQLPDTGIEALEGREHNDLVLWVESVGAVISGDTLVDFGGGLQIADWLRAAVTRDEVAARLRPLLERPIEAVLLTHGAPTDRAALERALG
jgi:hypothetical protein